MDYPLEKLFECCFQKGFNKPSYILEIKHFENSKKIGAKKVKKIKMLAKERKRKGENDFGFVLLQKKVGHNSGPPKQTYYCGSGLLMDYPLEKLFECCFLIGF